MLSEGEISPIERKRSPLLGRRRWIPVLVLVVIGVAVIWMLVPWAWSPVDDAGHVLALQDLMQQHGTVPGMVAYAQRMFEIDRDWGLFRPSYWLYPSFFYLLNSALAHAVRLVMVAIALVGPLLYFRRQGYKGSRFVVATLMLLAAGSSLYVGLFLVSLQELSAMAFIGLGLMFPNRWFRLAMWTVAAWFKAPFAWLLIGQAIVDWRRGRIKLAIVNALIGVGTLSIAMLMARHGSYTANYGFDPLLMWRNAQNLLEPMNSLLLVGLVWWLAVQKSRLSATDDTVIFGIGFLGYTVQLLPWGVTAYYMGPISFFLGLTLVSLLRQDPNRQSTIRNVTALVVPVLVTLILVSIPILQGFRINLAMRGIQDCLANRPGVSAQLQGNLVYVTSSEESPIRIVQGLQIADPGWRGDVALGGLTEAGQLPDGVTMMLNVGDPLFELPGGTKIVCSNRAFQAYERIR